MCLLAHQASLWADTKSFGYMREQLSGCSHTCSSAVGDHREQYDHPCIQVMNFWQYIYYMPMTCDLGHCIVTCIVHVHPIIQVV